MGHEAWSFKFGLADEARRAERAATGPEARRHGSLCGRQRGERPKGNAALFTPPPSPRPRPPPPLTLTTAAVCSVLRSLCTRGCAQGLEGKEERLANTLHEMTAGSHPHAQLAAASTAAAAAQAALARISTIEQADQVAPSARAGAVFITLRAGRVLTEYLPRVSLCATAELLHVDRRAARRAVSGCGSQ